MIRDSDVERLLDRQHGAVSRAHLHAAGVNVNIIDSWIRRGQLRRVLPGVYSNCAASLVTRAHAAHLWQPLGVVSHLAAAHLWRMAVDSGLPVTDVPRTIFDCLVLLDDTGCATLLDHATATLT